jgi:hypothetical protein
MMKGKSRGKIVLLFLGGIIVICMAVSVIMLTLLDDDDYKRLLTWAVQNYTDYRISIKGPVNLDLLPEPSLAASEISLYHAQDGERPPIAHIGQLRTKIAVWPLLFRTVLIRDLIIEDMHVTLIADKDLQPDDTGEDISGPETRGTPPDMDIPILESVTMRNVNVSYTDKESGQTVQVVLRHFNIDDVRDTGPLYVKGKGAVNNTDFSIDGQLGSVRDALRHTSPYPIDLALSIVDLSFRVKGTIADPIEGKGLDILINTDETELSNLLKVLKVDVQRMGYLDIDARVTGDIEAPRVSDFSIKISGEPGIEMSANGSIPNLITGEGTNIKISGSCANTDLIRSMLPRDLHDMDEVSLVGIVRKNLGHYTLKDMRLSAARKNESSISAMGSIALGKSFLDYGESTLDLALNLEANNTNLLKAVLFDWLPDTGPVTGTARFSGTVNKLALEDISITAGESSTVWIHAQGRVGSIPLDPDLLISGIDISLSIKADEAPQFFANLDAEIPELDDISGQARIHGSEDRLIFDGIAVHMKEPEGVTTDVSGNFILEEKEDNTSLGIFDLDINMDAPSLSTFRRLLAAKALPDLKPAKVIARLTGTTDRLSLEDLTIQAGQSGLVRFALNGRIGKLIFDSDKPAQEVDVVGSFFAENTSLLSQYAGIEIPDLGPIEATWRLVERTGGYGTDENKWVIGNQDKGWFHGTGRIEHVMRGTDVVFEGIDLSFEVQDFNSKIIADHLKKRHLDIGKINGSLSVSGSPQDLAVSDIEFLSISPEGLKASIRGGAQHIRPEEDIPFQGIDMELAVKISDMKALQKFTELDLPNMVPLSISASVNDRSGTLDVKTFQVRTGPEDKATLFIDGRMNDIFSSEKTDFFVAFEASTKPWLEDFYGHTVPEDHRIKGETTLTTLLQLYRPPGSIWMTLASTPRFARERIRQKKKKRFLTEKSFLTNLTPFQALRTWMYCSALTQKR